MTYYSDLILVNWMKAYNKIIEIIKRRFKFILVGKYENCFFGFKN